MCRFANQNHTLAHYKGQWNLLKASFSGPGIIFIMIQIINVFCGEFVCVNLKCQFVRIFAKGKNCSESVHQGEDALLVHVFTQDCVSMGMCVFICHLT